MDHISSLKKPINGLLVSTLFLLSAGCSNPWIANGFEAPKPSSGKDMDTHPDTVSLALVETELLELNEERNQLVSVNDQLKDELNNQRSYSAKLKLAYLAKHAEVNQLILDQQATIQEMVRIQAKLLSRNSRAETVSTLAEATMLVTKARAMASENQQPIVGRASQLLLMSNDALGEDNYDGSTFLANQAAAMVQSIMSQIMLSESSENSIQFDGKFAVPINMKSLSVSNVRSEPHMRSDIQFSLVKDQEVIADGYINDWIHIILDDHQQGWVYFRLIDLAL